MIRATLGACDGTEEPEPKKSIVSSGLTDLMNVRRSVGIAKKHPQGFAPDYPIIHALVQPEGLSLHRHGN